MATVMLMTTLCWWFYDGDRFKNSVTEFICWRLFYAGDFFNVLNRSPTSETCHQHISSPTSATNIDVTVEIKTYYKLFVWTENINSFLSGWLLKISPRNVEPDLINVKIMTTFRFLFPTDCDVSNSSLLMFNSILSFS